MKTTTLLLVGLLWCVSLVHATEQELDAVRYRGKVLYMMECPLNALWLKPADMPKFEWQNTGNYKGYTAAWEIRDNKLFLVSFEAKVGGKPFSASSIFRGRRLPIFASWYSGALNIPLDSKWGHDRNFNHVFGRLLILNVERGQIQSATEAKSAVFKYSWNL